MRAVSRSILAVLLSTALICLFLGPPTAHAYETWPDGTTLNFDQPSCLLEHKYQGVWVVNSNSYRQNRYYWVSVKPADGRQGEWLGPYFIPFKEIVHPSFYVPRGAYQVTFGFSLDFDGVVTPGPAYSFSTFESPHCRATAWMGAAYPDFLNRAPTLSELQLRGSALSYGTWTRETEARSLANSDEWLSVVVRKMYLDTLGREPDPAGLATWVEWLRSGRFTVAEVASLFYSSQEFYEGLGGNTQASWVTQLYAKLLGRAPDPAGLAGWVRYADDPARGRNWVAYQFYQSLESRMTRVSGLYQALLDRGPDPTGWPFWADVIQRTGDIELAVSLAASAEYLDKAVLAAP